MPRTHKKIPIAPGIYRDGAHLVAEVRIGSFRDGSQQRDRERFPLGTAIPTMVAWQHGAKKKLIEAGPARPGAGSLAADVPVYLRTLPEGKYRKESTFLLQHWADAPLGRMARASVERTDIVSQMSRWLEAGVAAGTVNKRLGRLRKFYDGLDGLDVTHPTDRITFLPEPKPEPRDIPVHIVRLILESIPDQGRPERHKPRPKFSKTKIRLRVMAWTGFPPATIARIRPRDLDLDNSRVYLLFRKKGKGADGRWLALLPEAVEALRDFVAAGLVGRSFGGSSTGKTWRVGIRRAERQAAAHATATGDTSWLTELEQLPPGCHPYDLRHAFGSESYRRTGDIRAASELLQHATLEQTKRYTGGAVTARVAAAIAKMAPAYAQAKTMPAPRLMRLVKTPS